MLCQFRTIGAGIGVLAVCFMLASLSWQHVLLGFALASVSWAIWSWSVQMNEQSRPSANAEIKEFQRRRRAPRPSNVYQFPSGWMESEASTTR